MKITIDASNPLSLRLALDKVLDHVDDMFDHNHELQAEYTLSGLTNKGDLFSVYICFGATQDGYYVDATELLG